MQPVFFISLFSLIFLMFSSMTAGLSKNIMQANIEKTERTKRIFSNIEMAINKIAFKEKRETSPGNFKSVVDLTDPDITDLGGTFISQHANFTQSELKLDPWKRKIFLLKSTERKIIWGGKNGQYAKAPITTFLLVSGGPNKYLDTFDSLGLDFDNPNPTANDIKSTNLTDESIVGDDIVVRFDNYEAMLDVWQRVEDTDNTVKNVALNYYKTRLDAFSPLIQLAQRDVSDGLLKDNIFTDGSGNVDFDEDSFYKAFNDLASETNKSFTNEWNEKGTRINTILTDNFRTNGAKKYANQFVLASPDYTAIDYSESAAEIAAAESAADAAAVQLSADLNAEFIKKYTVGTTEAEFLYPSFDVVVKDPSGNNLSSSESGLKNLGLPNISSLDPFSGIDGELNYDYNPSDPNHKPHMISIKRRVSPAMAGGNSALVWDINKLTPIDALGDI